MCTDLALAYSQTPNTREKKPVNKRVHECQRIITKHQQEDIKLYSNLSMFEFLWHQPQKYGRVNAFCMTSHFTIYSVEKI